MVGCFYQVGLYAHTAVCGVRFFLFPPQQRLLADHPLSPLLGFRVFFLHPLPASVRFFFRPKRKFTLSEPQILRALVPVSD